MGGAGFIREVLLLQWRDGESDQRTYVPVRRPAVCRHDEGQSIASLPFRPGLYPVGSSAPSRTLVRRMGPAQVDTIRRKLFKVGAIVHIAALRIVLDMSSAYLRKDLYSAAYRALRW
jgi:hypothetical protein